MRRTAPALLAAALAALAAAACSSRPITAPAVPLRATSLTEPADWQALLPGQLERARAAAARWRDLDAALAAGWKPFGGDAPLMGRHYHHEDAPAALPGQPLDLDRPNVLMYARIGGRDVLTGLSWTVRLAPGEAPPPGFAGPHDAWHVHDMLAAINAATEERPLLRGLARWWLDDRFFSKGDGRHRLAMVHVWTEWENPDGPFAAFDRSLPYRKLGLPPEWASAASLDAARGLNLATEDGCAETIEGPSWIAGASRRTVRALRRACEEAAAALRPSLGRGPEVVAAAGAKAWAAYDAAYERLLSADEKRRIASITEHHGPHADHDGHGMH